MASPLKGAIAKAVGKALKGICFPITYRAITNTAVKSGATYAIGVSTANFTNCPAGWGGVVPGDTFANGLTTHTVTNTVAPVAGTMTGVTFTPALVASMASGAAITITDQKDYVVRGIDRQVDVSFITNTVITANDYLFTLLADGLPMTPKLTDKIQTRDGKFLTIVSTAFDAAKASWTVQAR